MRMSGCTGLDSLASGSMNDEMTELRFPPAIENETMSVTSDPMQVSPIVVEEDDHSEKGL
jgi:hypothetical protein